MKKAHAEKTLPPGEFGSTASKESATQVQEEGLGMPYLWGKRDIELGPMCVMTPEGEYFNYLWIAMWSPRRKIEAGCCSAD